MPVITFSIETLRHLAEAARDSLPEPFRSLARDVVLRVAERASDAMLDDFGMRDPMELTGLYEGIPMTEKSVMDPAPGADVIWLFRAPIQREWEDRGDVSIEDLVANVYIHELAHHLGWSDDDIAAIDRWWE